MNSNIFTLNWKNILSALVSAVIMGILAVLAYVISVGDIFHIDSHVLINTGILATFTGVSSLLKNLLTDSNGNFAGIIPVK